VSVLSQRDLRGRVVSVGTSEAPGCFARYQYRADGSIAAETRGSGTLARGFERDALCRLTRLDDPAFSVRLGYKVGGQAIGPDGDGRVTAEATFWSASAFPQGAPSPASRTYTHDRFGRLSAATSADRPAQGLAQGCDGDGNILSRAAGGAKPSDYDYGMGTNRLAQVTLPAGPALPLAHDSDGAVTAVGATRLRHDGPGGRASAARTAASTLAYLASADGERS
jgi:hypothetical protein